MADGIPDEYAHSLWLRPPKGTEIETDCSRPLDPRDIINIDITIYYNGYHGDTSKTFILPDVDNEGRELVEVTKEALERGIKVCGPGMPFDGIGRAIG